MLKLIYTMLKATVEPELMASRVGQSTTCTCSL